jgi:ABC-2 type transport system permease protein
LPADLAVVAPASYSRSPGSLIARLSARRSLRSGVLWGYVFGVTVASSAFGYARIYKTPAERQRLAETFATSHAASALFGPATDLQTVAGFTVFKVSMTLMVVGAVWGLLTSTRLLRGEEDAGRWELLVSGRTTRGLGAAQAMAGLVAGATALWAITAVVTVVAGRAPSVGFGVPAGLFLALALVAGAVMFLAVGAVTSQLAATRRRAAGYAAAVLGVSYGLRMVGDAGVGAHWLVWVSPLGWIEQLQPLTRPRAWALLPIGALVAVSATVAVVLARRRDVGSSTWPDRTSAPPHLEGLSGPTALAGRLAAPSASWWTAGTALAGLLMGIVAKAAGTTIVGSSVHEVLTRLGAPGNGTTAFLGVTFLLLAVVVAFEAAFLAGAARAEEASGRLDHLLAGTVGRTRWISGRVSIAAAALVVSGVAAGAFSWIGTVTQGSGPSLAKALVAGLNIVPPAMFVLGVGVLALGLRPRWTTAVVYSVLGWSALLTLVGGFFAQNHWVLDTSLFHQMASAPAVTPDWRADGAMVAIAVASTVVGAVALRWRDVEGP